MKMRELPESEKPREKALQCGMGSLSDRELLALVLRTGCRNRSALELSDEILQKSGGMGGLELMSLSSLQEIPGIGASKALELMAVFAIGKRAGYQRIAGKDVYGNPGELIAWARREFGSDSQENFAAVFLDAKNHLSGYKKIYRGGQTRLEVHPRDVFHAAIQASANRVILVHNHPTQDVTPSPDDFRATRMLRQAGRTVGIPVVDHIIVSRSEGYSFLAHGMLEE